MLKQDPLFLEGEAKWQRDPELASSNGQTKSTATYKSFPFEN